MEPTYFSIDECNAALREAQNIVLALKDRGKTPAEVGFILECAIVVLDRMQSVTGSVEERAEALAQDYINLANRLVEVTTQ